MLMRKKLTSVLTVFAVASTLSACSTSDSSATAAASASAASSSETAAAVSSHEPVSITLGTASSSGTFYAVGAGMASAIEQHSSFLKVFVQATKGGSENTELINAHEMELGFTTTSNAYCSMTNTGFSAGEGEKDIIGVMALYPNYWQMLVRSDLDVETFADLKGLRVCLGSSVPEISTISKAVLSAHGVDPENDITPYYLSQDEACQKLGDGDIDAAVIMTGIPTALFTNLTMDDSCKLVKGDPDILEELTAEDGELNFASVGIIPAGTYNNTEDVYTISSRTMIITYPDVDEDVIYEFCKQVYENWDTIKLSHSALEDVVIDDFDQTKIPLHPGAEKYYEEIGILDE